MSFESWAKDHYAFSASEFKDADLHDPEQVRAAVDHLPRVRRGTQVPARLG